MTTNNDAALRKRQQIDKSRRTMFITVAITAFIVGTAAVVSFFLVKQIIFHSQVIALKEKALGTIKRNIDTVADLEENVRLLDTNAALRSARSSDESETIQVILDALPAEANSDALGASLQLKFVGGVSGLEIESMSVNTAAEANDDSSASADGSASASEQSSTSVDEAAKPTEPTIGFAMTVVGSPEAMKELLTRFERSIRVITLSSVEVQASSDGSVRMNLVGNAYYKPTHVVEIGKKVVKP